MLNISPYMHLSFVERGRDHAGVDCYGLHYLICHEQLGLAVPSYSEGYATTKDKEEIAAIINRERLATWQPVKPEEVQEGDLVILRITGRPWHCGTMLSKTKFLHIEEGANVCREDITSTRWARRVEGFFRWAN